jgi:hypothetical protein
VNRSRVTPVRLALTTLLTGSLLLLGAGTAAAHVEAEAEEGAQAGDGPVAVSFVAEAESASAGITGIKTQLPTGVLPESVSLASGPDGWTLAPTDDGYEITGPALAVGTEAEYAITIAQLPADRTEFVLKTLVRYSDGSEDAWIEEPTADNPEPENPAPAITVAPAAAPTSSSASSSAPSSPTPTSSDPADPTTPPQAQVTDDQGTPTWVVVAIVVVVVLAAVVGGLALSRRSRSRG